MTALPIVRRELSTRARHAGMRWTRWAAAAFAGLLSFQVFGAYSAGGNPSLAGQAAYGTLAWLAFLLACAAVLLTADCISSERRDGTLGLLFLTDLKGYDVTFGKLTATGVDAVYALVGLLPALALPLLAGGVTGEQIARTALALLNVLFVSLTAGLWISTRSRTAFDAMRNAALFVLGLHTLPWVATGLGRGLLRLPFDVSWLSPSAAFLTGLSSTAKAAGGSFWGALAVAHLEGWLFLVLASGSLTRTWRDDSEAQAVRSAREAERLARAVETIHRGPRYSFRTFAPITYRVLRLRGQQALVWSAAILSLLGYQVGTRALLSLTPVGTGGGGAVQSLLVSLHFGAMALFAWVAARFFLEARRTGELELLLCTPVGARSMISGQWHALIRLLRTPLIVMALAAVPQAGLMVAVGRVPLRQSELLGLLGGLLHIVNAVLNVLAVAWVGLWFGLRARKPIAAVAWTVGLVEGAPWLASYLAFALLYWTWSSRGIAPAYVFWSIVFPLLYLGKNLGFIAWARERLRTELRTSAILPLPQLFRRTPGVVAEKVRRARHWTPS